MTEGLKSVDTSSSNGALRDSVAGRAALMRLKIVTGISGGTSVREFGGAPSRWAGGWFQLKLWGLPTSIVDGALIVLESGVDLTSEIAQFMDKAAIHVARFAVARTARPSIFRLDKRSDSGLWFWRLRREHKDLLAVDRNPENLLMRLGAKARRNLRRSERRADRLGVTFDFQPQTRSIANDKDIIALAGRNRPAPAIMKNIKSLEEAIIRRGNGFQTKMHSNTGALISLCRGFIDGQTAYFLYQLNDPVIPQINLSLLHRYRLIEELGLRSITEMVFILGCNDPLNSICKVTAREEVICIRPSFRGLITALALAGALRRTLFGNAVSYGLAIIFQNRIRKYRERARYIRQNLTSPIANWPNSMPWLVGSFIVCAVLGTGVLLLR